MTTKLDEMRAYVAQREKRYLESQHETRHDADRSYAWWLGARETQTLALAAIDEARAEERAPFDALARLYDIEGDESSAETFERTLAGYGKALCAARERAEAAEARAAEGAGDTALLAEYGRTLQAIADAETRAQSYALMTPRDEAYEPLKERALALARGSK